MPLTDDESYTREIVRVVRELTEAVVEVRADVNRAVNPLYQRIVRIERHNTDDGKERVTRQQAIDSRFDTQDSILRALQWRSTARLVIDGVIAAGIVAIIVLMLTRG